MTKEQTDDTGRDLLRQFISDENKSFAQQTQGKFWPDNHHRLRPLEGEASRLLTSGEYQDYLFHMMRVTGGVPSIGEKDLPPLIAAWRRLLPFLDAGYPQMTSRHKMLFVFGFDDSGALADGGLTSVKELKARVKLISQVSAYQSMRGQRDKKARFTTFTADAPRILQTLRHLGYNHDRSYGDAIYDYTNLAFWGMVFITLLNPETRTALLEDMLGNDVRLVQRDRQLALLHKYVEAVLPEVSQEDTRFLDLAARLRESEQQRCAMTESAGLARLLNVPFAKDEIWAINIDRALRGAATHTRARRDVLRLEIRLDPDWQWHLLIELEARGRFSERETGVTQNDLHLPGLGHGKLHALPQWLARLREEHGIDFDAATAKVRVGRNRAAAKLLTRWLTGEVVLTA